MAAAPGYLLKERVEDSDALCDALTRVAEGSSVIDPEIVAGLLARSRTTTALDQLTHLEREVLRLMAEGRSNQGPVQPAHRPRAVPERQDRGDPHRRGLYQAGAPTELGR